MPVAEKPYKLFFTKYRVVIIASIIIAFPILLNRIQHYMSEYKYNVWLKTIQSEHETYISRLPDNIRYSLKYGASISVAISSKERSSSKETTFYDSIEVTVRGMDSLFSLLDEKGQYELMQNIMDSVKEVNYNSKSIYQCLSSKKKEQERYFNHRVIINTFITITIPIDMRSYTFDNSYQLRRDGKLIYPKKICDINTCNAEIDEGARYCYKHICKNDGCSEGTWTEFGECLTCRLKKVHAAEERAKNSSKKVYIPIAPTWPDCDDYDNIDDFLDDWDGCMPDGSDAEDYWENW